MGDIPLALLHTISGNRVVLMLLLKLLLLLFALVPLRLWSSFLELMLALASELILLLQLLVLWQSVLVFFFLNSLVFLLPLLHRLVLVHVCNSFHLH